MTRKKTPTSAIPWRRGATLAALLVALGTPAGGGEWWWVHQETIAPADVVAYENATREYLETLGSSLPLKISAVRSPESVYTYFATLESSGAAALPPESGMALLERLSREKTLSLAARGLVEEPAESGWRLFELPELSYAPPGAPAWPGDELTYLRYTFHFVAPNKEEAVRRSLRQLRELYEKKGAAAYLQVLRLARDDEAAYVLGEGAASRDGFADQQQELKRVLGAKGQSLRRKLDARILRSEVVEGTLRLDLSYPSPLSKVVPLEPFSAERPALRAEDADLAPAGAAPAAAEDAASVAAAAEPTPPADAAGVEAAVRGWAAAWSEQRLDDYLACYSRGFVPPQGLARGDWEAQRRTRVSAPSFIAVSLGSLKVRIVEPGRARADFVQTYRSDGFGDRVRKRLELVWEDGGWRIERETAFARQRAAAQDEEPAAEAARVPDDAPAAHGLFFIVATTMQEEQRALRASAQLRARGYPSEVFWSDSGYFVVTLDHLPKAEARRKRDQAVAAGDVPRDSYLITGTSFQKKIAPRD